MHMHHWGCLSSNMWKLLPTRTTSWFLSSLGIPLENKTRLLSSKCIRQVTKYCIYLTKIEILLTELLLPAVYEDLNLKKISNWPAMRFPERLSIYCLADLTSHQISWRQTANLKKISPFRATSILWGIDTMKTCRNTRENIHWTHLMKIHFRLWF